MAERYLIDTSAVIKYLKESFPADGLLFLDKILDTEAIISFVIEIELLSWNPLNLEDLEIYKFFIARSKVLGIDDLIVKETIKIRRECRLKLPDALIAATAIVNDLTLISDNDRDFHRIAGLKYINPNYNQA